MLSPVEEDVDYSGGWNTTPKRKRKYASFADCIHSPSHFYAIENDPFTPPSEDEENYDDDEEEEGPPRKQKKRDT